MNTLDKYSDKASLSWHLPTLKLLILLQTIPILTAKLKTYDDSITKGTAPQLYLGPRWGGNLHAGSVLPPRAQVPLPSLWHTWALPKEQLTPAAIAGAAGNRQGNGHRL